MKRPLSQAITPLLRYAAMTAMLAAASSPALAQTLLNVSFGSSAGAKRGLAATGLSTNDFWNSYTHYEPRFMPGMALAPNGRLDKLKLADGTESVISVAVTNAPGVWGNASGDPMYDAYMYSANGTNISVTITGLPPGRYHFFLYGHADADVTGEQNSIFTLKAGTNTFGPLAQSGGSGWKAEHPWQEHVQYVLVRDVPVDGGPVVIEAAPGANGIAVLNGLQIFSRGTSPPRPLVVAGSGATPASTNLWFSRISYDGKVSDTEARFVVKFSVESMTTNELSAPLFEGDVALVSPVLPDGLRIVSRGRQTLLFCSLPGSHSVQLELLAKIARNEPWNQISFAGPPAGIASVSATANEEGVEMQLLSGTQVTGSPGESTNRASSRLEGFLGADRTLTMRWQNKSAEITRKPMVTVETKATAQLSTTLVKFVTALHYDILQAPIARLTIELPLAQALTRIQGEQIRDWQVQTQGKRQLLSVEFLKPVDKLCDLTLFSEQAVEPTLREVTLQTPQPLEVERETGSLTLRAEDTLVELGSTPGLRQVNAPAGALAAYRFNSRPFSISARLKRIEPVIKLVERATVRLEETRLLVSNALTLTVEQSGIYGLQLRPQAGFTVTEVKGEGIEDWKMVDGTLNLSFSARVLGSRKLSVLLERGLKEFPPTIALLPLQVAGVSNCVTQLGVAASSGIRVKTASLSGLRETPIDSLPERSDELLAFASEQIDWALSLSAEKLAPRVVTDVFNLVTVGDGLVGGSATLRYGILNQGVQQFRIVVPPHWRNLEFTGVNIRRKEQQTNVWTITLQDKVWGGYTLVMTYDYAFDPKGATLDLAGAHAMDVERESGSLGLMTAASLKLTPATPVEPLHRVDESDFSESDRSLCTKPLLLAYKYTGSTYQQSVKVVRFEEVPVLEAVSDRTELTSVLTEQGQLLTQSSFMVKNNDKQFQRFKLPPGSEFWSSYVNGQPARPERDGEWFLVPLPRDTNRDRAFAVDIIYTQTVDLKSSLFPRRLQLFAPVTDIPNTYAEWQLFAPTTQRLSRFAGNMTAASRVTRGIQDEWQRFLRFYGDLLEHHVEAVLLSFVIGLSLILFLAAARQGMRGAITAVALFAVVAGLAAMLLPALSKAKSRGQPVTSAGTPEQRELADGNILGLSPEKLDESRKEATPSLTQAVAGLPGGSGAGGLIPETPGNARVSGIRPLRIEIPKAGEVFSFTKILNAGQEPLSVSASVMRAKVYRNLQVVFQGSVFGLGLLLLWILSLSRRNSFWMAGVAALVLWSGASLLTTWQLLHVVLIAGAPLLPVAVITWLAWDWWHRRQPERGSVTPQPSGLMPGAGAGSSVASMLILLAMVNSSGWLRAETVQVRVPDSVTILSANYSGFIQEKVAQLDVTLQLSTIATNLMVPLFGEEVALESFRVKGGAKLVREGSNVGVFISGPGNVNLELKLAVKLAGEASHRRLALAIPPALGSRVELLLDEPEAEVEFPGAVAFEHRTEGRQTRVEAVLSAAERLELSWTPRVKRAAEIAATVFVENTSLLTIGNGVVTTHTRLEFQISQGELRQIRVRIPSGQRVLRVEGEGLRLWEINNGILAVDLLKGAAPACQLTLETEQVLDKMPVSVSLEIPHALDVKRETGLAGLRGNEELAVRIEEARDLQRVDAEEFFRAAPDEKAGFIGAFRFAKPDFILSARVELERPRLEALVHNQVRIESESLRLASRVDYAIKRAGIFSLQLVLPDGYRLEAVTGTNVAQWTQRDVEGRHILEVTLKERALGAYTLNTMLERAYAEPPKTLVIEGVHPLGTEKLSGYVTVSTELGLAAKTEVLDRLTEIPFNTSEALPAAWESSNTASGGLAYKFASATVEATSPWSLSVLTEAVEPWVRAELMSTVSLSETLLTGRTQIRYDIANAPIKEFHVRVPASLKNVELTGGQIRRRDQTNGEWSVELQSKVRGEYVLSVTWEMPKDARTRSFELPRLEAVGVERESGFVALCARPPLQVTEKESSELVARIDARELPAWAGRMDGTTVLAYRYLRPGYRLVVDAKRFEDAEVLQTLIDNARLSTVVADDGQVMTEMSLSVRNHGGQHLEVELPLGMTVWSAFVAGEPVRPSQREGKLLLPLTRELASEAPVPVELTFVGTASFPKHRGTVVLSSPRFDVPLKNARWELYLPPNYTYRGFSGSMNRASDIEVPGVRVYSLLEYNEQQKAEEVQQRQEVEYGLKSARDNLSGGNLRGAIGSFSRAKARGQQAARSGEAEKDLEKVAEDVRRAQSSNLVAAQDNYYLLNAVKLGDAQNLPQSTPAAGRVDAAENGAKESAKRSELEIAGLQWDKLERAQQVAAANVSSLRVNLPTRGIHYTFAQVLQTELHQPMTIQLLAENTQSAGWAARLGFGILGFGSLWLLMARMNRRTAGSSAGV